MLHRSADPVGAGAGPRCRAMCFRRRTRMRICRPSNRYKRRTRFRFTLPALPPERHIYLSLTTLSIARPLWRGVSTPASSSFALRVANPYGDDRHGSPDRARSQWGSARLSALLVNRRDPSVQRSTTRRNATTASQRGPVIGMGFASLNANELDRLGLEGKRFRDIRAGGPHLAERPRIHWPVSG